jgi:hypothetical protein
MLGEARDSEWHLPTATHPPSYARVHNASAPQKKN